MDNETIFIFCFLLVLVVITYLNLINEIVKTRKENYKLEKKIDVIIKAHNMHINHYHIGEKPNE